MSKNEEWRQTEAEIAAKYPGELTDTLLALREAPTAELKRRVAAISDQESRRRKVNTPPSIFRRRLALAVVVLLLAVGALFAVPQWRVAVAHGAAELWLMMSFGMSTSPESVVTFQPAPPFDVYQPTILPDGYQLKAQIYQQG